MFDEAQLIVVNLLAENAWTEFITSSFNSAASSSPFSTASTDYTHRPTSFFYFFLCMTAFLTSFPGTTSDGSRSPQSTSSGEYTPHSSQGSPHVHAAAPLHRSASVPRSFSGDPSVPPDLFKYSSFLLLNFDDMPHWSLMPFRPL